MNLLLENLGPYSVPIRSSSEPFDMSLTPGYECRPSVQMGYTGSVWIIGTMTPFWKAWWRDACASAVSLWRVFRGKQETLDDDEELSDPGMYIRVKNEGEFPVSVSVDVYDEARTLNPGEKAFYAASRWVMLEEQTPDTAWDYAKAGYVRHPE